MHGTLYHYPLWLRAPPAVVIISLPPMLTLITDSEVNSRVDAACDGVAQQRVISPTRWMQRQDIDPFRGLASNLLVGPSSHVHESPASLGGGIAGGSCKPTRLEAVQADTMTPGQQALRVARQRIQITDRARRLRGVPGCSHAGNSARCEPGGDWHHQGAALRAVTAGAA